MENEVFRCGTFHFEFKNGLFPVYRLEEDGGPRNEDDGMSGFRCRGACSPADEDAHSIRAIAPILFKGFISVFVSPTLANK